VARVNQVGASIVLLVRVVHKSPQHKLSVVQLPAERPAADLEIAEGTVPGRPYDSKRKK
jgi:hypothetical protein